MAESQAARKRPGRRWIGLILFLLLLVSGAQTLFTLRTYELAALQAHDACLDRARRTGSPRAESGRCSAFLPFWQQDAALEAGPVVRLRMGSVRVLEALPKLALDVSDAFRSARGRVAGWIAGSEESDAG